VKFRGLQPHRSLPAAMGFGNALTARDPRTTVAFARRRDAIALEPQATKPTICHARHDADLTCRQGATFLDPQPSRQFDALAMHLDRIRMSLFPASYWSAIFSRINDNKLAIAGRESRLDLFGTAASGIEQLGRRRLRPSRFE
jgi:hypothetical protein